MKKMDYLVKLLTLGGVFLSMYSILEVVGAILGLPYEQDLVYCFFVLTLSGFAISFLYKKPNKVIVQFLLFALLFILIMGLWFWFIALRYSVSGRIYWQAVKGGLFIISGMFIFKGAGFFGHLGSLQPGLVFILGPLMLSELYRKAEFLEKRLLVLSILFIFFAICKDWLEQTHFLFTARGVELQDVRKKIVRRGLFTAVCTFGLILGITNLKGFIWFIICTLTDWLYRFVAWLISLIPKHKQGSLPLEGFGFMPFDPQPSPYPLVVFMLYFISSFVGLSLLLLLLSKIGAALKRFAGHILRLLLRLFMNEDKVNYESEDEFTDIVEETGRAKSHISSGRRFSAAAWLQRLEYESDPIHKVRICYRIIVMMLKEHIIAVSDTDTTGDIYRKASRAMEMPERVEMLEKATCLYDRVRYGAVIPDECEVEDIKLFASRQVKRSDF